MRRRHRSARSSVQRAVDERMSDLAAAENSSGPINNDAIADEQENLAPLLEGQQKLNQRDVHILKF